MGSSMGFAGDDAVNRLGLSLSVGCFQTLFLQMFLWLSVGVRLEMV